MITITLWILMTGGSSYRPPMVVDRFDTEADCKAAVVQLAKAPGSELYPFCLRATVIREKP